MKSKTKIIFSPQLARWLVQSGFTIIDLKPNKRNSNETIFVFQLENGFGRAIQEWLEKGEEVIE